LFDLYTGFTIKFLNFDYVENCAENIYSTEGSVMKKIVSTLFALLLFIGGTSANASSETLAPGLDVLGYGYNVFGEYADQASKKRYCLFRYKNYAPKPIGSSLYNVPEYVILENISNHIVKTVKGESIRDYAKSLASKAGFEADTMFFSGSIESSFKKEASGTSQKYYFTYMDANTKWRISLDERRSNRLREMLDPDFLKDLQTESPERLFETYGTHYIASAYIGGRADFTSISEITKGTTTREIDIAVTSQYKAISIEASSNSSWAKTFKKSKTKTSLRVVGGNSEYANNIQSWKVYKLWADGIEGKPVLCDFDKDSLKPIWNFCKDRTRKAELVSAFEKMCKERPLPKAVANILSKKNSLYMVKNKAFGLYWDLPEYEVNLKAKAPCFILTQKDRRTKEKEGADRFIKIIPHHLDREWVYLQPQNDIFIALMKKGSASPGEKLTIGFMGKNHPEQLFKMKPVDGETDTYFIKVKSSGLYLGGNKKGEIFQERFSGKSSQKWFFEATSPREMETPKPDTFYTVQCKAGRKYWDFAGSKLEAANKGGRLSLWSMDKDPDRYIKIKRVQDGWYLIQPQHSPFVLDIPRGTKKASHIQLWEENRSAAQLFRFEYAGEPNTWFIRSKISNKVIDADAQRFNSNGCPVSQWKFNGGDNQKWIIQEKYKHDAVPPQLFRGTYYVKCSYGNKYWDLPGNASQSNHNGSHLSLWNLDSGSDRRVRFVPAGGGYWWIEFQNGGRRLDVKGKSKKNGGELHIWNKHNGDSQKFRIVTNDPSRFIIISKHSGKAIDIKGGKKNMKTNGVKLHQWTRHNNYSQQWIFVHADGRQKGQNFTIY